MNGHPWSDQDVATLSRMDGEHASLAEIAAVLGRTPGAVGQQKSKLGLTRAVASCESCGTELIQLPRGRARRFCGFVCARRASRPRRELMLGSCENCGGDLTPGQRRFCSRYCSNRSWYLSSERRAVVRQPRPPRPPG